MPATMTTRHNPDADDGGNDDGGGGFSLMHALKGGASVASSCTHSDADSTALLREGLASPAKTTVAANNKSHHGQHRSPAAASHHATVPMRAVKSFTSSTNYHSQREKAQQQRRAANYRHAPKKFSPRAKAHGGGAGGGAGRTGGGKQTASPANVSPANSGDSEDSPSSRGGGDHQGQHSLKATSFDDCYSSATPGYHDAFALLAGAERGAGDKARSEITANLKKAQGETETRGSANPHTNAIAAAALSSFKSSTNHANAATPSPRSGGVGALRSFFPSSPRRSPAASPKSSPKRNPPRVAQAPPSPMLNMPTIDSSGHSGVSEENAPRANADGSKENDDSSPPAFSLDGGGPSSAAASALPNTPTRSAHGDSSLKSSADYDAIAPSPSFSMPAPPSGKKKKPATANARAPSPVTLSLKARAAARAASPSPLGTSSTKASVSGTVRGTASPLRHSSPISASRMKSTLQKWSRAGVRVTGRHARTRSKGSGNYSYAVSEALQEDLAAGKDHEAPEQGKPPKSGDAKSSGSKSQEGIEVVTSPSTPGSRGSLLGMVKVRSVRNRSPSPVRHLNKVGGVGGVDGVVGVAGIGSAESYDDDATLAANNTTKKNENEEGGLHVDRNSVASTPSFFGMRQMSPGRMKRSLKKRLAVPSSPRSQHQRHPPPQAQQQNQRQQLQQVPSTDDEGMDLVATSLAHTTMSFDVDDAPHRHAGLSASPSFTSDMVESALPPMMPPTMPSPIPESELKTEGGYFAEGGYFINTTSFNIFESREFLRAMGGRASEASLATNYIRTGDDLCRKKEDLESLERAVRVYYAGLGKILTRIRDWSMERRNQRQDSSELLDANGNYIPSSPAAEPSSDVSYKDLLEIAHSPETNVLLLAMSSILLRAGNAHFRRGRWEDACRDYASARSYRSLRHEAGDIVAGERREHDGVYFEDAKLSGRISNNTASAQSKRWMYEEARSEYTRALQIKQGTLEALHRSNAGGGDGEVDDSDLVSDIASTFHNIGLLRMECGEPKKAEKAYKQSLSLRVKKFGLDDLGVSATLRALGDLYHRLGQHDDAFRSYKESLRIWKSHGGRGDLRTAEHYYNIGLVFYAKGPLAKARTSAAECLRIRRLLCSGEGRLPVAAALYLLGLIASASGCHDEARSLLEEALDIRRALLEPPDHLLVLNVRLALGTVHRRRNDPESAMDCLAPALEGRTRRLGRDHPSVAEVLQAVGETYATAQEYQKAFRTFERALRIRRLASLNSVEVAETLDGLSLVLFKSGDAEKAIELSKEALDVLKSAVGFDHLLVGSVLKNVGDYYQDAESYDDAMEAYSEGLRVMTAWHGREHVFLSEVLNEIGVTRFKNGEYMLAKQSFTEALRLMRLTHNEANKSAIFPTLNHLGHALYKSNELKLAAETYIESFNIQVSIVTGDANDGVKEFGTKLNTIKDRLATMEPNGEDIAELSESLGGIASILRYLGLVIQEQGDFEAALSANKLSLSVRLCQPFKEHPAIALMAETIAMFEYKRNNLPSAMDYFNQALEAKKLYQGESTIDVARTVNNLANIHFSLGNLDDAMELYQEALEIKRHCLGDDSDEVANTLNNIAHVMVNAGKEQEALGAYHNVVKIRQDRYGKSHPSVAATLASMGDVYIKLGKLEIAMTYFEQCIRIQKLHQDCCDERVLENLGSIYGKLGEWHKAASTFEEIVELKRAAHGDECLDVAKTLDLLAVSYIEQDRHVESIEHLREALRIRKVCLDDEDDEILASLNKLAFVYKSLDMTEQMVEMREEFEALQERRRRGSC